MIKAYIKRSRIYLAVFLVFAVVFSILTYLYGAPLSGVLYAVTICLFFLTAAVSIDFYVFYKKYHELLTIKKNILNIAPVFYNESSLLEGEYQSMISTLHDELRRLTTKIATDKTEMTDFYSLWVHQIKTPISAMSLMLQKGDYTKNRELMQELFKIEQYTELVLSYLRLGDISKDLSYSVFKIDNIVKQAVKKYAPIFISKSISLELSDISLTSVTDEKWLCFAIEQILSNALKYTKSGGNVKIYTKEPSTIIIEDNGIGIAAEDLPRIFEKGFTGYNGRMDKKATGIGLYLTKTTLDKLGHKIEITSKIGFGTAVKINVSRPILCIE